MAAVSTGPRAFALTPHKVSVCILIQIYSSPSQIPFTVSQHNNLGLYLLSLTKSCDDVLEPKLNDLVSQLREIYGPLDNWITENLTNRLSSLSSPDDLFNFFSDMRGSLGGSDSGVLEDDQCLLDPNSNLGIFLRRCLLAFNSLCFEATCHLLTSIEIYCKEALSSCSSYEPAQLGDSSNDFETPTEYENMDLENFVYRKVNEEIEARKRASEMVSFHLHVPKAVSRLAEDIDVSGELQAMHSDRIRGSSSYEYHTVDAERTADQNGGAFLRTNWQIQGYLLEQAEAIKKHGSSVSLNAFELVLRQLQKLAPELHRVHFLRYLSSLQHDDYFAALENLLHYFDYSAGNEGFDFLPPSTGCNSSGRYEIGLLCLAMMHSHFRHPKEALKVFNEAVLLSQQHSNDTCLAYTLAAICNLLSEIAISGAPRTLGSSYSPLTCVETSFSVQQQLFPLLGGSLKRAENLKLKQLVAANNLAIAKFDLTHVQRPMLSFGPKVSMKLRTSPVNVCKELRLCSRLISDFSWEDSITTMEGSFSTAWLKNLQKPIGSLVFSQDNAAGSSATPLLFCMQPSSIPGSVLQLVGSSYLLRATAWEMYGSASLARVNSLIYATCFADSSSSSDAELVHVKLIQHLAMFKGYKEAFSALRIAEEKFLCVSKSRILILKLQLLHEYALHRGHLKLAQQACAELGVLASTESGVDMDLKTEASLRHARTLLVAKEFNQALAVVNSLFHTCYKANMQVENATVLLLLAEIHMKSGNPVLGLPYALASLSFCQSFNLDILKASATLTLAELWLMVGPNHAKRALGLIHSAFPMILGHGGLELRARAYMVEAKCHLSDPNFSVSESSEMVLDPLTQASDELQALEYHELAAEAFYLMAIVYNKLENPEKREEAAEFSKKHIMALENPQHVEDPLQF